MFVLVVQLRTIHLAYSAILHDVMLNFVCDFRIHAVIGISHFRGKQTYTEVGQNGFDVKRFMDESDQ